MKTSHTPRATDDAEPSMFRICPVPLLEEDISGLRSMIGEWQARGIRDVRAHLERNPDVTREAIRSVRIVDANDAALRLYEVDGKDALLGPLGAGLDLQNPLILAGLAEGIIAIAEGRDQMEMVALVVTPSGKNLDVEARVHMPRETDSFANVLVALIDRAEHRRLERKVERERVMLQALVDAIPDQVFLKGRDDTYLLANKALVEWAGVGGTREVIGKSDLDLFPGEIAEKFRADDQAILESGEGKPNIEEQIGSGAARRWALTTKVPFRDEEGLVAGIVGIVRDITSLKQAQEAQRESERRYRAIIDDAPVGILRTTLAGKIVHANPAFARIVGYDSPEELVATVNRGTIAEVLYMDPSQRGGLVHEALQDGAWRRHTARFKRRDGEIGNVTLTVRTAARFGDAVPDIEGFVEDVTERTRAEEALARERTLLEALMDTIPDHIYFKDLQNRFLRVNRSHLALFGLDDPVEVIGKTDFDFFAREHAEKARQDELRIMVTGEPIIDARERLTWPDRPETWVSTTKMPLRDVSGQIVGTFGISRDITERRRMEEKTLRLAALVESSSDAIVGLDIDRRVTSWNRGAVRIYGYTSEEAIGQLSSTFISPGYQDSALELRERILRGEFIENFETMRRRKDGKDIQVSLSLSPIWDAAGTIIGIASIARDITAQKALQAQILRAQRLESLRILAGGIAHQFNNINTVVKGYLDILAAGEDLSQTARCHIERAMQGIQRAVDITERMQGLSGTAVAREEGVGLDDLIHGLMRLFEKRMREQAVEAVLDLATTSPAGMSQSQLGFIVTSLVSNALDAMLSSTRRVLTVSCGTAEGGVFFAVADTGVGIGPEGLARLFTPFYTTKGEWAPPGSPQAAARGVGLSLAVCQSTVAESGGRIEVEGGFGTGATFRVWLPPLEAGPVRLPAPRTDIR